MVMELLLRACLCKLDKVITCLIYATKKCKYAPDIESLIAEIEVLRVILAGPEGLGGKNFKNWTQ